MKQIALSFAALLAASPAFAQRVSIPTNSGGGSPSGSAGGALAGTYPNPTLAIQGSPCSGGQFATALSAAGALTCATPSGSISGFGLGSITPVSGRYYPFFGEIYFAGAQFSANTLIKCHPVVAIRNQTATGLAGSVATAATGNFALALYNISADGTRATTLIANTGSLSSASAVLAAGSFGAPVSVTANTLYEICAQMDNTNAAMTSAGTTTAQLSGFASTGSVPKTSNTGYMGISYSGQTFGTWPDLTNATFSEIASGGAPAGFLVQQ